MCLVKLLIGCDLTHTEPAHSRHMSCPLTELPSHQEVMANGLPSEDDAPSTSMPSGPFHLAHTLLGHKRAVASVQFCPANDHLSASASADQSIHLWNVKDGTCVSPASPMVHTLGVNSVAWNAQGNYLASVSDDQTVKIWDVEKGTCLRTMTGHSHYVFCCQFNPVGHVLVSLLATDTV